MWHVLCAIIASDSACPCNYKYFRSCFCTSLSHTRSSLPPLRQPGNPGIQVTTSSPTCFCSRLPAFPLCAFLWMTQRWWTAPTFVFVLFFACHASLSPFLLVLSFVMTSLKAAAKVNDATALRKTQPVGREVPRLISVWADTSIKAITCRYNSLKRVLWSWLHVWPQFMLSRVTCRIARHFRHHTLADCISVFELLLFHLTCFYSYLQL